MSQPPTQIQSIRRKVLRTGNSASKLTSALKDKLWHVFLGRLDKETSETDITEHLEASEIKVSKVSQLLPQKDWQKQRAAFHVFVELSSKEDIFNLWLWPANVIVCDWYFKSHTTASGNTNLN